MELASTWPNLREHWLEVIKYLSLDELRRLASTNRRMKEMIETDVMIWLNRFQYLYGEESGRILFKIKPNSVDFISWENYLEKYFSNDSISEELALTVEQAYIRKMSEFSQVRGSRSCRSIHAIACNALLGGNLTEATNLVAEVVTSKELRPFSQTELSELLILLFWVKDASFALSILPYLESLITPENILLTLETVSMVEADLIPFWEELKYRDGFHQLIPLINRLLKRSRDFQLYLKTGQSERSEPFLVAAYQYVKGKPMTAFQSSYFYETLAEIERYSSREALQFYHDYIDQYNLDQIHIRPTTLTRLPQPGYDRNSTTMLYPNIGRNDEVYLTFTANYDTNQVEEYDEYLPSSGDLLALTMQRRKLDQVDFIRPADFDLTKTIPGVIIKEDRITVSRSQSQLDPWQFIELLTFFLNRTQVDNASL